MMYQLQKLPILFLFLWTTQLLRCQAYIEAQHECTNFDLSTQSSCYCGNSSSLQSGNDSIMYDYIHKLENSTTFDVNATNGVLTVEFQLLPCLLKNLNIELKVVTADVNPSSCLNYTRSIYDPVHSNRIYKLVKLGKSSVSQQCQERGKVEFLHIVTGCYYVKITPKVDNGTRMPAHSEPQFLVTTIKKVDVQLAGRKPSAAPYVYKNEHSIDAPFSLTFPLSTAAKPGPEVVTMSLHHVEDSKSVMHDCCEMRERLKDMVDVLNNTDFVCRSKGKDCVYKREANTSNITFHISCTFTNVTPGNYNVRLLLEATDGVILLGVVYVANKNPSLNMLHFKDIRCTSYFWSEKVDYEDDCTWNQIIEFNRINKNNNSTLVLPTSSAWTVWVVLGVVCTFTFVALLYGLYVLLTITRRDQDAEDSTPPDDASNIPLIPQSKILLLYARDCAPFMDAMLVFRELLQQYCSCEVLDCYDEDNQQEIFTREHDWLLGQMNHVPMTDLKVVLVATECSAAHQLAQIGSRGSVEYRDPDPCDKIFPLALKLLKEDVNPGLYARVKLVELSGFKIANESLSLFPTPFTRFTLPNDFKELIGSLRQLPSTDQLNVCDDDVKKISAVLNDLLQYKKDNPMYLETIIS